ncbi:MAG: hypothetical protein M3R45_02035 [Pseudomonadota bacterium]|nr:hypothetical protein [Pseudomonadota bacterium]
MPLPTAPTLRPNNPETRLADHQTNKVLLIRGLVGVLLGLIVLLSPAFITAPDVQGLVATASLAGWAVLVLGCALIGLHVWRRMNAQVKP